MSYRTFAFKAGHTEQSLKCSIQTCEDKCIPGNNRQAIASNRGLNFINLAEQPSVDETLTKLEEDTRLILKARDLQVTWSSQILQKVTRVTTNLVSIRKRLERHCQQETSYLDSRILAR